MKHYVKVLSLSVPLSFLFGLLITYYQDQIEKDPNFLKPEIRVLVAKGAGIEIALNNQPSENFAVKADVCESHKSCQEMFGTQYDLAILTPPTIKRLASTKSLAELIPELKNLLRENHVDFRRPHFDPEARFSLPVFWNVLGFFCPSELCDSLLELDWSKIEEKDRKKFIFVPDRFEQEKLLSRGLWREFQYHSFSSLNEMASSGRPIVQWPSGGVSDKMLYELQDYKYRFPKSGSSIAIYSIVFPGNSMTSKAIRFARFLMSEKMVAATHKSLRVAFTKETGEAINSKINKRQSSQTLRRLPLKQLIFEEVEL